MVTLPRSAAAYLESQSHCVLKNSINRDCSDSTGTTVCDVMIAAVVTVTAFVTTSATPVASTIATTIATEPGPARQHRRAGTFPHYCVEHMTTSSNLQLRTDIIAACIDMNATGLNQGTSGNISIRIDDQMLITPTSLPYHEMEPEDIVSMSVNGEYGSYQGRRKPSTEWRFHLDTYRQRADVGAMVHTHSIYATTLSMLRADIPACHYMVAVFGGSDVRCADYAIFGSEELSANVLKALEGRSGCLLGTHGMLTCGTTLKEAMWRARELETLSHQYYLTLQSGRDPVILDDQHIQEVISKMKSGYGIWSQEPTAEA